MDDEDMNAMIKLGDTERRQSGLYLWTCRLQKARYQSCCAMQPSGYLSA